MQNEEENSKPVKRKRKSLSSDGVKNKSKSHNQLDKDEIKKMLTKVIMQDMMAREYDHVRDVEIDSLIATNKEFMKCFMIIGYDLNEVPIVLFQADSQLQADALSSAITKLVINGGKTGGV